MDDVLGSDKLCRWRAQLNDNKANNELDLLSFPLILVHSRYAYGIFYLYSRYILVYSTEYVNTTHFEMRSSLGMFWHS